MATERDKLVAEVDKWQTKVSKISEERLHLVNRLDGLRKGRLQKELIDKAELEGDEEAKKKLKVLNDEQKDLPIRLMNLKEARDEAQRRLNKARIKLAQHDEPELVKEVGKIKGDFEKWFDAGDELFERLGKAQRLLTDISIATGKNPKAEIRDTAFAQRRLDECKDWLRACSYFS